MSERIRLQNEEDLARLRGILKRVVADEEGEVRRRLDADRAANRPTANRRRVERRSRPARVLDLACGDCREAEVLAELAAEWRGFLESGDPTEEALGEVELTGIDVRAREIEDARRRFGGRREFENAEGARDCRFLTGDASRLDEHRELGDEFDLVFLRHQNYWNGARTWEEIYDQALHKVGDEGKLVITSYFDREHALALDAIERLGGELVRTERNSESRSLPTAGKSVDRHVAVFRKRK